MTDRLVSAAQAVGPQPIGATERTILGILGGTTVAAATYPIADQGYVDLFTKGDVALWIGFLIRLTGAAAIGGIWSFIHRPETDPGRAFQLGLVAPAMIAGMIYANGVEDLKQGVGRLSSTIDSILVAGKNELSVTGVAHAQGIPLPLPTAGPTGTTFIDRVVKGVLGK